MIRNIFSGIGNLGGDPERKGVLVGDDERFLVQFSVYFPNPVGDGNGSYRDKGGFWCSVAVWSPSLGDQIMLLLRKGARVFVTGRLRQSSWEDGDGTTHQRLELAADEVSLSLLGIQEFTRSKAGPPKDAGGTLPFDDELPY